MMPSQTPLCLCFDDIAPGRDFHAALAADFPRRAEAALHTHDFPEAMYVLDGAGTHSVNGAERPLRAGDLLWIRPADRHTFWVRPGAALCFINIAFRADVWDEYRRFALAAARPAPWEQRPEPPAVPVPAGRRAAVAAAFQEMLRVFHRPAPGGAARLALGRFWADTLPLLAGEEAGGPGGSRDSPDGPPWLVRACLALEAEDALRGGVPRLTALCGVSPTHLARTLKARCGVTPTEFVSARRLDRAAALLATTTEEIAAVALDCGFQNLSHFYRCFGRRFGTTPRGCREQARRAVLP